MRVSFPFLTNLYSYPQNVVKPKFFIKNFFSKCDQIRKKMRIWSDLLKKSLMTNFIFLCSAGYGKKGWL